MSDIELKPCPFCGSTNIWVDGCYHGCGQTRWRVVCTDCMGQVDTGTWKSKWPAIAAWNRRYEPTCCMRRVFLYDEECVDGIECDECGWTEIHDHDDPMPTECPECRRKVVDE